MRVLQVKDYHESVAKKKMDESDQKIKSMFYFMKEDARGYATTERQRGYVAFNDKKAVFGMNEQKAIEIFNN